jgi:sugar transferase (PEP-CTERM/EpsH1 system associated)
VKTPLLFLCHRIPYPPNKGDKIRSFHLLHHLSQHFEIYLATFVDDPADWPYVPEVEKFCGESLFIEQKKWPSRLRGLTGLLTGQAISIPFYACGQMQQWICNIVEKHGIRHAMVFSSSMAQYVLGIEQEFERKIVDFVDVDSDKWQQYSEQQAWPMSWLYRREARKLLDYETELAQTFDHGLFVSCSEAELFRKLSPETAAKVGFYNNGVNTDYFAPGETSVNPYPPDETAIVFTGAMDYWPNVDATVWFAAEVLPLLRERRPEATFYIVGSNPSRAVLQLASNPGVVVTGRVEDIRPYIQYATVAIAPMRIARGVQNKVLEAMAMERPVVVSTKGLEGIPAQHGTHLLLADTPAEYLDLLDQVLAGGFADMGSIARQYVSRNFNWDNNLPEVVLLLGQQAEVSEVDARVCHG